MPNSYFLSFLISSIVRLYQPSDAVLVRSLQGHQGPVLCCSFSQPGGSLLASGGQDSTVRVWESRTGECTAILRGHRVTVLECISHVLECCMERGLFGEWAACDFGLNGPARASLERTYRRSNRFLQSKSVLCLVLDIVS